MHLRVLFRFDESGDMVTVNEPPYDPAPRFFLGITKDGNMAAFSGALPAPARRDLRLVAAAQELDLGAIFRVLEHDGPVAKIWLGPAYVAPPMGRAARAAVRITAANKDLLLAHFPYTREELHLKEPCFAIVQGGCAVSVCCSARQSQSAAEASLNTIEAFRGCGFGADVARAWAKAVQDEGRTALYSTAVDNFASQAVAAKFGLIRYGTDLHIA